MLYIRRHWALPAAAACEAGAPRSPSSPAALPLRCAPGRQISGARAAATMLAHFPFAARTPRLRSAARALLESRRPATSKRRPSLTVVRCGGSTSTGGPNTTGATPPPTNEPPPLRRAAPVALSRCVRSRSRGQRSFGPRGDPVLAVRGGRCGVVRLRLTHSLRSGLFRFASRRHLRAEALRRGGRLSRDAPRAAHGSTLVRSPVAVLRACSLRPASCRSRAARLALLALRRA